MVRLCHRCHAELPGPSSARGSGGSAASDDEHALFCPQCGVPQIQLPEYMRTELTPVGGDAQASTTGKIPPPRPQLVEWSLVLLCIVPVALVTASLSVAGLVAPAASFVNTLCILGGSGVVLGLYRSRRPLARIDGRVGLRIGLLTGMAMIVMMGIALAATGVIVRFAAHGMGAFDADLAQQFSTVQAQLADKMQAQSQGRDAQQRVINYMSSPEVRAGLALFYLSLVGGFILTITTVGGGFAGMLQTRRRGLPRGN